MVFSLTGDASSATGMTYKGHNGDFYDFDGPEPWITNSNGIGLLSFYNALILPYPAAVPISISAYEGEARLTWTHSSGKEGNRTYESWRSTSPYFEPNPGEGTSEDVTPPQNIGDDATYDALGAIADASENDYYLVRGRSDLTPNSALYADISNRVGVFHYPLVSTP